MPYQFGNPVLNTIKWRVSQGIPRTRIAVPASELGITNVPISRVIGAPANPVSPLRRGTAALAVLGNPSPQGTGGDRGVGPEGMAVTSAIDPMGATFNSPEARKIGGQVAGVVVGLAARAVPALGIVMSIARMVQALVPPHPATTATATITGGGVTAVATAPDPVDPTTGITEISADHLAQAGQLLNDAMVANLHGDYTGAITLADRADQLAGGVLGKGGATVGPETVGYGGVAGAQAGGVAVGGASPSGIDPNAGDTTQAGVTGDPNAGDVSAGIDNTGAGGGGAVDASGGSLGIDGGTGGDTSSGGGGDTSSGGDGGTSF